MPSWRIIEKLHLFSLETSMMLLPIMWTQPTATRRTTPRKLPPASKRSENGKDYILKAEDNPSITGNWHLHGHGTIHHCSKTPRNNCRNLWVWGEQLNNINPVRKHKLIFSLIFFLLFFIIFLDKCFWFCWWNIWILTDLICQPSELPPCFLRKVLYRVIY